MKFQISSAALMTALGRNAKVILSKTTLSSLDHFLFRISGDTLTITSTDKESVMISRVTLDSADGDVVFAVPMMIVDSLSNIPDGQLDVEVDESTWLMRIHRQGAVFEIPGISGVTYPDVTSMSHDSISSQTDPETILSGISKTLFATASDGARPILCGVYVCLSADETIFVATDAHRLVKRSTRTPNSVQASFVLSRKSAAVLKAVIDRSEESMTISFDSKSVAFSMSSFTLICRLIEGAYPNYNAVIPVGNPNHIIVDRVSLLNSVRRVGVCASQDTNLVKLVAADNRIDLYSQDVNFSYSAHETIECSYQGNQVEIGFKFNFLSDILSNMETDSILIELADSTRAGVFKPIYSEPQESDTLMLLMPMVM